MLAGVWIGKNLNVRTSPRISGLEFQAFYQTRKLAAATLQRRDEEAKLHRWVDYNTTLRVNFSLDMTLKCDTSETALSLHHYRILGVDLQVYDFLDQVFARQDITWWRLVKIDCEGLEYEVLSATSIWDRMDRLCGEFHTNDILKSRNCSPQALSKFCAQRLAPDRVAVSLRSGS